MEFNTLAFIGRFQPFHNGHKAVVDMALSKSKKVAIVIGSHDQPRNSRNPLTTQERIEMISAVYPSEVEERRITFIPQVDHTYNLDRWIAGVQSSVTTVAHTPFNPDPIKVGLIGHSKDATSFYLKSFPTWESIECPNLDNINATDIRRGLYLNQDVSKYMPEAALDVLTKYHKQIRSVAEEYDFVEKYKSQWSAAPYAPTFHTVDAVVVQSGHILLVERGANPGKGLWALPGGFLDPNETLRTAAIRELKEETKIDVPLPVLNGSIEKIEVFDDPHRSLRGRTITTAYLFRLADRTSLPKIKASDDAAKAKWISLGDLDRNKIFEDHFDIIENMMAI